MAEPARGRILLVDDNEIFLKMTSRRLEQSGYATCAATCWADAIPLLRKPIDLCLLDVHLLSLSGDRLCAILKKTQKALKVVLYSSEDPARLAQLAFEGGADGHLSKSVEHVELSSSL